MANDKLDELTMLRTANSELTVKAKERKAKVAEHEATITDLQSKLTAADGTIKDLTIGAPLKALAATVSAIPEIWIAEFAKHYKLESKDGKLAVLTLAGDKVLDGKEPVEFTPAAIVRMLTDSKNKSLAAFRHITSGSLATGGGSQGGGRGTSMPHPGRSDVKPEPKRPQFGLR